MPKFVVTKTFEVLVKANSLEDAKELSKNTLDIHSYTLPIDDILSEQVTSVEAYVDPIEVAYTGWDILIRQGIDEWKFEYEIGSLEVYVDGDLYHLREPISSYDKFVEHSKTFVKESPNA